MLQRIQSLYLLIAAILSGGLVFMVPFWTNENQIVVGMLDVLNEEKGFYLLVPALFIVSVVLSLISLFSFKKRSNQIINNRINIVVNFFLLGIIVYRLLNLPGETEVSEKGIGMFIPLLVIVFLVLANKSIQKDERLVKSVDRLR